jgi:hypothetical protein
VSDAASLDRRSEALSSGDLPSGGGTAEEQLAALLAKAYVLADGLTKRAAGASSVAEVEVVEQRVTSLEVENADLSDRNNQLLKQHAAMVMLFVSSERLHASLEPATVATSIWEILVNLVGAEEFFIAIRSAEAMDSPFEYVALEGVDSGRAMSAVAEDPVVAQALADGNVVMSTEAVPAPTTALAAVPLRMTDQNGEAYNLGVIVIFKLLDHKATFAAEDGDVLSLLGGHAATAFVGASAYARLHRKVKTMESLMNLLKK